MGPALDWFIVGVLVGVVSTISLIAYLGSRGLKKKKAKQQEAKQKAESLEKRMLRVKEITKEQIDLARRADGPQKNSLDGKYKNGLIRQIKQLEEERNDIMRSILNDGYDPELTAMDESGVITKMKLSEYMAYMGIAMDKPVSTKPTRATEQIGKFTVIRGGRDDDDGETTH